MFGLNLSSQVYLTKDYVVGLVGPTGMDVQGTASAVDYVNGYVYTCGSVNTASTGKDLILVKHDFNGVQQWSVTYDFASLDDKGNSLCVDGSGNIYVTGASLQGAGNSDIVTIKYNSSGTQQWVSRVNGNNNTNDAGKSILFDGTNVWITGYATVTGKGKDAIIMKLNGSTGATMAQPKRNGTANADDIGERICSDGTSVFITGITRNTTTNGDVFVACLNISSGTLTWSISVDGSASGDDSGLDCKIDNGELFVCGYTNNTTTGDDYYFARINKANGTIKYSDTYDGGYNGSDMATSLAPNMSGRYAITGLVTNGSNNEYHTRLLDTSSVIWTNVKTINAAWTQTYPKIVCDTIADHFYVCGTKYNTALDAMVYQMEPDYGNVKWTEYHEGTAGNRDMNIDMVVDGMGRLYVASMNESSTTNIYDIKLIRYSQTPVYFPIDSLYEEPDLHYLFYPNQGQVQKIGGATEDTVVFATMDTYPNVYVSTNRFSYKFVNFDTLTWANDTSQRVDIQLMDSRTNTMPYPSEPNQGLLNFMDGGLSGGDVLNVQGYNRYMVPNIYNGIDLHYYSNENGLKLFYVVKPFYEADISQIKWAILGANSTGINGTDLEIEGFNRTVVWDAPYAYQVDWSANVVPLSSAAWTSIGTNTFGITTGTYNPALPLVIELDYGNPAPLSPTANGNLDMCTFYGGSQDEGFRVVKVNKTGVNYGSYVTVGSTRSYDAGKEFPTAPMTNVTSAVPATGGNYLATVLFDSLGRRMSANIYGIPYGYMNPVDMIYNGDRITVIGNCSDPSSSFPGIVPANFAPNTYTTNTAGPGWVLQFQVDPTTVNPSINKVRWFTRTNGYANGISFKPNTKDIYMTTSSINGLYTYDPMPGGTGSYQNLGYTGGIWHFELSKYDSVGVRKYNQILPIYDTLATSKGGNLNLFENSSNNTFGESLIKCKIDCDKYGCVIAGEFDKPIFTNTKYGVADITNGPTFPSGRNDAFVMRFNAVDTMVYTRTTSGTNYDAFTNVKITGDNNVVLIGYSASTQTANLIYRAPGSTEYKDSIPATSSVKVLINALDTIGTRKWGTFFGNGNNKNVAWGITCDATNYYISGVSLAGMSFPISNPVGVYSKTSTLGQSDGFMLAFDLSNHLAWNTYLGGSDYEAKLSLDWNPAKSRLMFTGISNSAAKILSPYTNYFPATQASTTTYPGAWYVNAINSSSSGSTVYYGPHDGYVGWFLVNNIVYIGIQEYFKDANDNSAYNLYPNPTSNEAYIAFKNALNGKTTIEVYNQIGQLLYTEVRSELTAQSIISINTSRFADGIYFVNVKNGDVASSKKLVVTH